jgi:hypothetical protein
MDIGSHRVAIDPKRSKIHQEVALSLKDTWETIGMPSFLQIVKEQKIKLFHQDKLVNEIYYQLPD